MMMKKIEEMRSETSTMAVDCREECSRAVKRQAEEECKDIFLSHSGFQNSFAEQLHRDLARERISSFLATDLHCLPKGKPFPSRILSNARNCKVAVLVLSPEFLSSKWPMLELSEIVKARKFSKPDMAILPLFFKISAKTLKQKVKNQDLLSRWKELQEEDGRINCEEWGNALKEICNFNGIEYPEDEGEVFYRDRIVDHIRLLLPPDLKYDDSLVQGKTRLCQEVGKLFEKAEWRNGVKVVGLHGIGGTGKTTISTSLCNFYSRKFKGKVFHAEFGRESCVETQKQVLKALTDASDNLLNSVTSNEQGSVLLRQRMSNQKVFMAMDNISDTTASIEAARSYLSAGFKEGSMILLTARSPVVLKRLLREEESSLSRVPSLKDEEAMAILLKLTHVKLSDLRYAEREVARDCIRKCRFGGTYHPLAIQAFGAYLFDRFGSRLLKWNEITDFRDTRRSGLEEVFCVFEPSLMELNRRYIEVFMSVALYLPHGEMRMEQALGWLAVVCNERVGCVRDVVNNLKKKGLIEEDNFGRVRVHDLIRDFAEAKANGTWRSWWCFRGVEEVPARFKQSLLYDRFCLEGINFTDCSFGSLPLSPCNIELFANVRVLNLESICQLRSLNLRPFKCLRSLVVRDCRELKEIEGIEHLSNIGWIEVDGFNSLIKAPQIEGIESLRGFHWECRGIDKRKRREPVSTSIEIPATTRLGDLRKCIFLESIETECPSLQEFPKLEALLNLQTIYFRNCRRVTTGPDLSGLLRLRGAYFDGCSAMTTAPHLSGCSDLRNASFKGCSAMTIGPDLSGCSELRNASFEGCSSMTTGPDLRGCWELRCASFKGCSAMATGPDLSGCSGLQDIYFDGCSAMTTAPDLSGCSKLLNASFKGCSAMTTTPDLSGCSRLQDASFEGCSAMTTGADLSGCSQLQYAHFHGCSAVCSLLRTPCIRLSSLSLGGMESLGSLSRFTALRHLNLIDCGIDEAIDITTCREVEDLTATKCRGGFTGLFLSVAHLSSLRSFTLRHCEGVVHPPDLTNCRHLENVEIRGCSGLTRFPNFAGLSALKRLVLRECHAVDEAPDLSGCKGLQEIELRDNLKMERLPWMLDCTSLSRLDLSWGIAVDTDRTPQQLRTCPIFRHRHSLTKHFGLHSLGNKYYRTAEIRMKQTELH